MRKFAEQCLRFSDLAFGQALAAVLPQTHRMRQRMISEPMPLRRSALGNPPFPSPLETFPHDEKRRANSTRSQFIEHAFRHAFGRTVVKRESDLHKSALPRSGFRYRRGTTSSRL